ncbi:UPF0561 protein C2orf68 homolog isoform X3 [Pocillopora damicornis]|uniref:UPF0561 protein C2orf68 homolog isoform X3 n=1 Tax=Pocillopora damicornis TaxID=46731 RepID=UPI000F555138|nr:UPF0561 protein C2orf68 homolog isoform X3 [Pocillopora damicornis]
MEKDDCEKMSTKGRETPRLNMEHGFIQSIIKNQVDRDEYDKEQKLLKLQNKPGGPSRRERPKRAAMQVYVPPHLRQKGTQKEKEQGTATASKTEDWEAEEKPASEVAIQMKLEFVRQDGKVSKLDICEGEDLKKVVSSFGRANGLDARLRDALYHRISTALKERAV